MELDSNPGLTKKPILFQLSQVESRTSSRVYVPSHGQSTIKKQCLVAQMATVLKPFDGKDNGIPSATIIIQHGSQAYFIPGFRQIPKGSHWRGPKGTVDRQAVDTTVQIIMSHILPQMCARNCAVYLM